MSLTDQTILVTGGTGYIGSHTVVLFEEMARVAVKTLAFFSSSATASGEPVYYEIAPHRAGGLPECYTEPSLTKTLLGW